MTASWPFGDLPPRTFKTILADPPWAYKARTPLSSENWTARRDAEKHYPVLGVEAISALPIAELAHRDSHLFLWVPSPFLKESFKVIEAWGFTYSTNGFTWIKLRRSYDERQLRLLPVAEHDLHFGLGHTTRKNTEFCLLARRGNARRRAKDVREAIMAPVRQHSRKPDEVFTRVERYCDGPYLELFARQTRPGWSAWGDEVHVFDAAALEGERRAAAGASEDDRDTALNKANALGQFVGADALGKSDVDIALRKAAEASERERLLACTRDAGAPQ